MEEVGEVIRIYVIIAAVAIIGALLWHDHRLTQKLEATRAELVTANATLSAERAAREHEIANAKEHSDAYEKQLADLRAHPPIGPVRLCKRPAMPATSTAGAARESDAPTGGRVEEPNEEDIGPAIDGYVNDCEAVAARLDSLQGWIRSR